MTKEYLDKAALIDMRIEIKIVFEEQMYREQPSTELFDSLIELENDLLASSDYVYMNNTVGIDELLIKYEENND